jgi:serine/arginine repetitive matrix protein 1
MFHDFQGTNADQDNRFSDKEKKLLKQMKFEEILSKKVKKNDSFNYFK